MEHKLITGGVQYLPFARSRIKALRAAGLRYATQRFVFPDAMVRIQVVADVDYIEISGGTCEIGMDSGVVELTAIGSAAPQRFDAGILYETDKVAAYNAPFVLTAPETYWRYSQNPTGQLSGTLSNELRGKVPVDEQSARSFHPRSIDDTSDPPVKILDPADETLYAKKVLTVMCPPSIFTGRCRLWVQSMYGRHMHSHSSSGMPDDRTIPIPTLSAMPGTPSIYVQGKAATGTLSVLITTSCGVYLDTDTGDHWLFKVNGAYVLVYPLIASPCGQRLRKYLISGTEDDLLNAVDRDHLEAYVLSTSRPDTTQLVTVDIGVSVEAYSMGYGWHWNWTGLVADIVVNTAYAQDATNAAMISTHHRITMIPPTDTIPWLCTSNIVEGPTTWSAYRANWTVVEPDWTDLVLRKTTPKNSSVFASDAPFYAFYVGDTLKMCRINVALNAGNAAGTIEDKVFTASYYTYGLNVGSRKTISAGADYYSATFSCGGETTPGLPVGRVITYPSWVIIRNKVKGGWIAGYGSGGYGNRDFTVTDDFYTSIQIVNETSTPTDLSQTANTSFEVVENQTYAVRDEYSCQGVVVVPFYDSEAVYLQSSTGLTNYRPSDRVSYRQHQTLGTPGSFIVRDVTDVTPGGHSRANYEAAFIWTQEMTPPTFVTNTDTVTGLSSAEKLVCHAGVVNATFSHLSFFGDNAEETVEASFTTLSGTDNTVPVVLAPGYITAVGAPTVPDVPALVGWV